LPGRSWHRSLGYGVLLLAVFGFIVMDPGNPDYRLFGPPWVNVGTFSLAYVLFGLVAGLLADTLDQRVPTHVLPGRRWLRAAAVVSTVPLVALAGLTVLTVVIILFDASAVLAGGLIVALLVAVAGPRLIGAFSLRLPTPGRRFWYAAAAVPGLIGFVVTLRNIVEIMGG
jgi:hypothetical protein